MDSEVLNLVTTVIALVTEIFAISGIISTRNASAAGFSNSFLNKIDVRVYKVLLISASWALLVVVWALATDYFGTAVMKSEIRTFISLLLSLPAVLIFSYAVKWLITDSSNKN